LKKNKIIKKNNKKITIKRIIRDEIGWKNKSIKKMTHNK
jgi:hypothetical protein